MPRSLPIASIFGTTIRLHWTFLLFLTALAALSLIASGLWAAAQMILLVILIFSCVLLHEFGHITVARIFGIYTPEVVLLPIGGLAKLRRIPSQPRKELAIAAAGPAANFGIFAALSLVLGRWPELSAMERLRQGQIDLVEQLAIFNLAVGVFNLLPAFPMDGGRIFRALLSLALPRHRATRIAARVGQALAIAMATIGLMGSNFLLVAIGIFIFLAAWSEAQIDMVRHAIGGTPVGNVMVTGYPDLTYFDPLMTAADAILHTDFEEFPVFDAQGHLAGILVRQDLLDALARSGPAATVAQAMRRDIPKVTIQCRAEKAAELIEQGAPAVGVVDSAGRFLGLVNWRNLLDFFAIKGALKRNIKAPLNGLSSGTANKAKGPAA